MAEPEILPNGVELRDFEDQSTIRKSIFDGVRDEFKNRFPYTHGGVRLELIDEPHYVDPESYTPNEQNEAILNDRFLSRRLRGGIRAVDEKTGDVLDEKSNVTFMKVPYWTERGSIIHGGNEYTHINQARLIPGVYSRRQANGDLETQFNVRPGSGKRMNLTVNPGDMQYRLRVGGSNLHLYSLLHDLGVPESQLEKSWGKDVLTGNQGKYDKRVLPKAYAKLVAPRHRIPNPTAADMSEAIREALSETLVNKEVMRMNLPNLLDREKAAYWVEAQTEDIHSNQILQVKAASLTFSPDVKLTSENATGDWQDWWVKYAEGSRTEADASQIKRWKIAKATLTAEAQSLPTGRNLLEMSEWALQPEKYIGKDDLAHLKQIDDMLGEGQIKAASTYPSNPLLARSLLTKAARYGAGVIFRNPDGTVLLEENRPDKGMPEEAVGKLRPAGGGKSKSDKNLKETIIREIGEEFGLDADFVKDRIRLLGYINKGTFSDCAMFEMVDHGLKPGMYQASNSPTEKIKLVESTLDDPRYVGEQPDKLRKYSLRGYHGRGGKNKTRPWVGVDLDGTLAHIGKEEFDIMHIGKPIPKMVAKVKRLMKKNKVKIFTARAHDPKSIPAIEAWCRRYLGEVLEITNVKDPGMQYLMDDRAVSIEKNMGTVKKATVNESTLQDALDSAEWEFSEGLKDGIHWYTDGTKVLISVPDGTTPEDEKSTRRIFEKHFEEVELDYECGSEMPRGGSWHVKSANSKRGYVMVPLSEDLGHKIVEWSRKHIQDIYLADNGREFAPHVTVMFGIHTDVDVADLRESKSVAEFKESTLKGVLGTVGRFERNDSDEDKPDVLKISVKSQDLDRLHASLCEEFSDRKDPDEHPTYNAHITLAYVKPGTCSDLDDHAHFEGMLLREDTLVYSSSGRKTKHTITL